MEFVDGQILHLMSLTRLQVCGWSHTALDIKEITGEILIPEKYHGLNQRRKKMISLWRIGIMLADLIKLRLVF